MNTLVHQITLFHASLTSSPVYGEYVEKAKEVYSIIASQVFFQALFLIFIFHFGVVGCTIGAIAGGLIGLNHKMMFLHDVVFGAVSGVVLSHKVTMATVDHFLHADNGDELDYFRHVIEIFAKHLEGWLLNQEMDRQNNNNIHVVLNSSNEKREEEEGIETNKWSPKIKITNNNILDNSGNQICCSICLQDFEVGNVAESLPQCMHMFHPHCISKWYIKHSSCPLCRRPRPRPRRNN